mgnify:CR=1 FL=1
MRGHLPLIAMRRKGFRPATAVLEFGPLSWFSANWHRDAIVKSGAHIDIEDADNVQTLDFRFVIGMVVMISGEQRDRVVLAHQACRNAGAAKVISHVQRPTGKPDGSFETVLQMVNEETTFEATV